MTEYRNIKGKRVRFATSDLSNADAEGQIFWSDSSSEFKVGVASAAWSSGAPMLTARGNGGGAGTSTSAFVASGYTTTAVATTEEYNGTGYLSGGNVNTARPQTAGAGTETAGLIAGGLEPPSTGKTEEYNGSAWTESGDLNIERRTMSGTAGTQTAALYFGGYRDITPTPNGVMNSTESYNGTSWTNEPALNTAVWGNTGDGTQTAAVSAGGPPTQTEHYDGSSWTTNAAINNAKIYSAAAGTTSNIVIYGGTTDGGDGGLTGTTELYDGTSWTEVADMATARRGLGKAGEYNTAIAMGGLGPAKSNTEEFHITAMTVTQGAWTSGGNLNTGRKRGAGGGTQTAALFAGGFTSPPNARKAEVEEYNGSAWSEVTNMPTEIDFAGYGGTQTAQVTFGGNAGPGIRNATLEYDGSSWTAGNNMGTARYRIGGAGTQTAALGFGGYLGSPFNPASGSGTTATEEYDGTNWTAGGAMSSPRNYQRSCSGIQTNAIAMGGGAPYIDDTEKYNGSSWSASEDYLFGNAGYIASNGPSADDLRVYSKGSHGTQSATYNGTVYTTAPSLATGRQNGGVSASATSSTSTYFGGHLPGSPKDSNATEEFTAETTALNLKTITDS